MTSPTAGEPSLNLPSGNDELVVGLGTESDLPELCRIARHNFLASNSYDNLRVTSRYAERNSVKSLRKKLISGQHTFIVARRRSTGHPVGFAIVKALNERCLLGTRLHVAPEFVSRGWVSPCIGSSGR